MSDPLYAVFSCDQNGSVVSLARFRSADDAVERAKKICADCPTHSVVIIVQGEDAGQGGYLVPPDGDWSADAVVWRGEQR
jgi:hypothetical protein